MRDDPSVAALVTRARNGDKSAWDAIVERYASLVWGICGRYRLSRPDVDDVGQTVWLHLVEQLPALREPAALPGWLATTTNRECLRVVEMARKQKRGERPIDPEIAADSQSAAIEEDLLAAERHAALREGFAELPPACQRLLSILIEDPRPTYAEISTRLGMPIGSIGPNRARCLDRLRQSPAVAALINTEAEEAAGGEKHGKRLVE